MRSQLTVGSKIYGRNNWFGTRVRFKQNIFQDTKLLSIYLLY